MTDIARLDLLKRYLGNFLADLDLESDRVTVRGLHLLLTHYIENPDDYRTLILDHQGASS